MNATIVNITGNESDSELRNMAWKMFCMAHPLEAYFHNPDGFWEFFHQRAPGVSREEMVAILMDFKKESNANLDESTIR